MQLFKKSWSRWALPLLALATLTIWYCEPGTSLNPTPASSTGSGAVPVITVTATPSTLTPTDSNGTLIQVMVLDSSGNALSGIPIAYDLSTFRLKDVSGIAGAKLPDTVLATGKINFHVLSSTVGQDSITISAGSGSSKRSRSVAIYISGNPIKPFLTSKYPTQVSVTDSSVVTLMVLDSLGKPVKSFVELSSSFFSIISVSKPDTISLDTTAADGSVAFRIHSDVAGTGTISTKVTTAAGVVATMTLTVTVTNQPGQDRPRNMVFTALKPTLKADGSDSTQLRVLVKDDNNNPLVGEVIRFTATGGLVLPQAVTDSFGRASGLLISERANKTVVVTATLVKTGATAQQTVTFDGITIGINASKKVIMRDSVVNVEFVLTDANGSPMSGDTLELLVSNAYHGFGQRLTGNATKDSMLVQVDTRGQYATTVTSQTATDVLIEARALGARTLDTVTFTNNNMTLTSNKSSIVGNGVDQALISAKLVDGNNANMDGRELRWTTTFGSFTSSPFTLTAGGSSSITLQSPKGSGLAIINVEAYNKSTGKIEASGAITVRVKALPVHRLELKVTPDNIPVKIGEATLMAQAFDSADNVMSDVLVGFKMVQGAGGGDEVITPPVDYTKSGSAQATFKAGGVISFYQGVRLTAVALDISGTDTLVVASSDTVGLTISGPPAKVSIGANILKGVNPNDGTFALPTAAVVTDVNGNLVADGTPVNFGLHPVAAHRVKYFWNHNDITSASSTNWYIDSTFETLPWTDYNNNGKLDSGEEASKFSKSNPPTPYRGEDQDGDGIIRVGPDSPEDLDLNGVWDSTGYEPTSSYSTYDSLGKLISRNVIFKDFNGNGKADGFEPFLRNGTWILNSSQGNCRCYGGGWDSTGHYYEKSFFGSPANRPYPGYTSVGIDKQVATVGGKALTQIVYVQSDATHLTVRITAEANGIRNSVDVWLPVIQDGGK